MHYPSTLSPSRFNLKITSINKKMYLSTIVVIGLFNGYFTTGKVPNTYGRKYIGYDLKEY